MSQRSSIPDTSFPPRGEAEARAMIRSLMAAQVEAELQIATCVQRMGEEESLLVSLLDTKGPLTPEDKLSIRACRMGIRAWKASLKAFRGDLLRCASDLAALRVTHPQGFPEPDRSH